MLVEEAVEPGADVRVRVEKGLSIGKSDLPQRVPMSSTGREGERPTRRDTQEPSLRIEVIEERKEVVLVRAAAVEEDERARRLVRRRTDSVLKRVDAQRTGSRTRGLRMGVRICSTRSRRCSKLGGRASRSPRCSGGSSAANPGPIVAISKRTPLGSRK
jgi:hypothetical protein